MKGHKHSEETKKNMSETRLKRKEELGYINSPETIERMRAAAIGRNATAETRRKMSMQRGGKNNPSDGKSPSEKTRQKMIEKGYANVKRFSWERCAEKTLKALLSL